MKLYKFYAPEIEGMTPNSAFAPDYSARLIAWTNVKKYRNWFVRSRIKGTYTEIVSEVDEYSDEFEEIQISYQERELYPFRLKVGNDAAMGAILPRITNDMILDGSISILKSQLSMIYDIKAIRLEVFQPEMREALYKLSYDILADDIRDEFSIDIEGVRDGHIPLFWFYLFMEYNYLDIDGVIEVSNHILKYLDEQEEYDEE